jgi:hypothetical protein
MLSGPDPETLAATSRFVSQPCPKQEPQGMYRCPKQQSMQGMQSIPLPRVAPQRQSCSSSLPSCSCVCISSSAFQVNHHIETDGDLGQARTVAISPCDSGRGVDEDVPVALSRRYPMIHPIVLYLDEADFRAGHDLDAMR